VFCSGKKVEEYEAEIAQYEMVKKDWQNEKTSLQLMLDRYQAQLVRTEPSDESLPATEVQIFPALFSTSCAMFETLSRTFVFRLPSL